MADYATRYPVGTRFRILRATNGEQQVGDSAFLITDTGDSSPICYFPRLNTTMPVQIYDDIENDHPAQAEKVATGARKLLRWSQNNIHGSAIIYTSSSVVAHRVLAALAPKGSTLIGVTDVGE